MSEIRDALIVMFRRQIDNWRLLDGIAYGLSREGLTRLEIMRFYWDLVDITPSPFTKSQIDLVGDYCAHLLGNCAPHQIVRLYGDPEDPEELADKVAEDAKRWIPPT